jgi:hypothetical protein
MDVSRTRSWSWLALFLILAVGSSGCEMPSSGGATSGTAATSSADEAERTRKIEAKAAEIERKAREIETMTGTDQEKIDAVNELDRERRELAEMQEGSS